MFGMSSLLCFGTDCKFSLGQGRRIGEEERGGGQNGATIPVQFIGDYFKFGHRMT